MSRSWLTQLQQQSCIAVIRAPELELGRQLAHAVASGGIRAIEITWNSDRPADLIAQLRAELPDCTIGTGTLMTVDDVEGAIAAGAQFLFSPHVNADLIARAIAAEVPIVPGALSPTEIVTAWQAGATAVKVFPISAVGGPSYIKSLQGPLGQIPLIPTGGVTLANTPEFLASGAIAVGLAGDLFPKEAVDRRDWTAIGDRAAELIAAIAHTRAAIAP